WRKAGRKIRIVERSGQRGVVEVIVVDVDSLVVEICRVEKRLLADICHRHAFVDRTFVGAVGTDDRVAADLRVQSGDCAVFADEDTWRRCGSAAVADHEPVGVVESNSGGRSVSLTTPAGNVR